MSHSATSAGLYYSVLDGHISQVEQYLKRGGNPNITNSNSTSAIACASRLGHYDCVRILIQNGADINKADDFGKTPVIYACFEGYPDILKLLILHKPQINFQDIQGRTALMYTILQNNPNKTNEPLFYMLIEAGDRKSTRLNSSHSQQSRMPSSA